MKRLLILLAIFICVSLTVSAQGFYFDMGLGLGKAWTKADGHDVVKELNSVGAKVDEIAVDVGLKAGVGPFGFIPLYGIVEFGGIGHRININSNYVQFNSFLIGPGLLFYPIRFIQLGFSIGYSFVGNLSDYPNYTMYDSTGGFAWNVSAAFDLGGRNNGCLIGVKYFYANNELEVSKATEKSSMLSFFVRYAHRKKAPSLF